MSGAYEEYMKYQDRGLSQIPETNVCSSHLGDDAIRRFINLTGTNDYCTYCGKRRKVVPLENLMFYITDCIGHFFTDPVNFMSYESSEGGYLGTVYDASELLSDYIGLEIDNYELHEDIHNSFDTSRPWANEYEYYNSKADYKMEHWDYFKNVVKTQSRFLFTAAKIFKIGGSTVNAHEILKEIGHIARKQKLISTLPPGTPLYRCRQHRSYRDVIKAEHICSPPSEFAIYPNRMSPAGISMFYSAFDIDTAKTETVVIANKAEPYYSSAIFKTRTELNLLDLSIPRMPSIFDQRKWKDYDTIAFLKAFTQDVTKSIIKDGRIHIDYVPTQIVTEYFRYTFTSRGKNIDGIIYNSSKRPTGKVCVLFMDHDKSLNELDFDKRSLLTKKI